MCVRVTRVCFFDEARVEIASGGSPTAWKRCLQYKRYQMNLASTNYTSGLISKRYRLLIKSSAY